jgi:hypothetical protein
MQRGCLPWPRTPPGSLSALLSSAPKSYEILPENLQHLRQSGIGVTLMRMAVNGRS